MEKLFELVRTLVDIASVTGSEGACGEFLAQELSESGFEVEMQQVSPGRANVFAWLGRPEVVLTTHMDTVGPFFAATEDEEWISGRGSCDAKGCLACQITAAKALARSGARDFGLLFVVGEETVSDGARVANQSPRGSRYLILGEPTGNRLIVATKGNVQLRLRTRGHAAHSAYPELGDSAIEKLLGVLGDLRTMPLPRDPELGPTTMNIGLISGGVAANVIPAEAEATLMFRTVAGVDLLVPEIERVAAGRAEIEIVRAADPMRLVRIEGFETQAAAFTTDAPNLDRWGQPLLIGPGSILAAHTAGERVSKQELVRAVEIYRRLVRRLKSRIESGATGGWQQ